MKYDNCVFREGGVQVDLSIFHMVSYESDWAEHRSMLCYSPLPTTSNAVQLDTVNNYKLFIFH